jgi:uncharacterized RDD family membrane protein YckC
MGADIVAESAGNTPAERRVTVIGIGRRSLAAILDTVFIFFMSMIVSTMAGVVGLVLGMYSPEAVEISNRFVVATGLLVSILYYVIAWSKGGGQTIGNFTFLIRVVNMDGSQLGLWKAVVRYIGYLVSGLVLSLGFLWVAFDGRRQGWHDKIARTYVIAFDEEFSANDQVTFVPSDPGRHWIWLVGWLALAVIAPSALFSTLWVLGPFIHMLITTIAGR